MCYKKLFIIALSLSFTANAISQSFTLSPYSKFGLGDISYPSYVPGYSMGFTSIAQRSNRYINRENPAAATQIDTLSFVTDISIMGRYFMLQSQNYTHSQSNSDIHYLAMGFPITKNWKNYIGLAPISNIGYQIQENKIIDTLQLTNTYKGDGGLNEVFWSNAWDIIHKKHTKKNENIETNHFHRLALGLKSSYVFGSLDKYTSATFPEELYVFDMNKTERNILNGVIFKGGLQYQYLLQQENNFEKTNKLKVILGLTYQMLEPIQAKQTTLITKFLNLQGTVTKDTIQNIVNKKGKIEMPQSIGFGLTIETNDKFTWSSDVLFQHWANTKFYNEPTNLKNSIFVATGIQFIPDPTKFYQYWKMTQYRLGTYFNQTYLDIYNQHINEFGITFGLGLPITKTDKGESTMIRRKLPPMLNISLAYGTRGTLKNNLIKENFWQFSLSLNIHDIWFIKRKFN
ncbi:MAG: hypothetical protein N2449_05010 [Bacteroidales bacterium]|nr:hypothetical protein [Bacteroidales bacterium]